MLWRGEEKGETQRKENVFGNISTFTPLLYSCSDHRRAFLICFFKLQCQEIQKFEPDQTECLGTMKITGLCSPFSNPLSHMFLQYLRGARIT